MSLLKRPGPGALAVDEAVKKALAAYGQARPEDRPGIIRRLALRMSHVQRAQLTARLAEISLGQLWVLLQEQEIERPSSDAG